MDTNNTNEVKRTATQRIEDLEGAVVSMYQTGNNMARDVLTLKEAIKLMGNKVDAIVKVVNKQLPLTDENIAQAMIDNNVEELKGKVTDYIDRGSLVSSETIQEDSFVVGRELNEEGKAVNPRIQFSFGALTKELQEKMLGSKVGDLLDLEEGKLRFEVTEIYQITKPSATPVVVDEATPESTEAQTATTTDTSDVDATPVGNA